jgi:glutamyl-Q tRNA(Asp) synthetase
VRIEDLDRARAVAGMADQHLRTLEAFGFVWDGPVRVQSAHLDAYAEALARLRRLDRVYECTCTRAEIAALKRPSATPDEEEQHYPGLCRSGLRHEGRATALRLRVSGEESAFDDRWQGRRHENVARSVGDFIVRRRDGIYAYQLAVVVDDALQGVTDVVRGCDLITSTPRQLLLQEALGLSRPSYAHVPLIVAADGQKLAKSRHSIGVGTRKPGAVLADVLAILRQRLPRELAGAPTPELWAWAIQHWNPDPLCGIHAIGAPA